MPDLPLRPANDLLSRPHSITIFISAAEPSGDQHAAELIHAIRHICPESRFFGLAGPLMQAAGCEAIDDWTAQSAMLTGALGLVGRALRLIGRVGRMLATGRADLAILVDSPMLHLPMAKKINAAGCPVLYYVAPQLWAWAPWRIHRLRKRVDRLAVILPFEQSYFRDRGMNASYVGHPLIGQLARQVPQPDRVEAFRSSGKPVIACLPGSRRHVIDEVLPGQIEIANAIFRQYPDALFLFSAASESAAQTIRDALASSTFNYRIESDANAEILSAADLALCASGTATLEVAYHRTPMIVMYNGSKWGWRLFGRVVVRTPHLSLVNILAGRRIVPEFMPYYTSTEPIAAEALNILASESRRAQMKMDLNAVIESLGTDSAANQTAAMAMSMIGCGTGVSPV